MLYCFFVPFLPWARSGIGFRRQNLFVYHHPSLVCLTTMPRLGFILVLLCLGLASFSGPSSGQSCVPYKGSPATGGKCDSIVTYSNVYLATGKTLDQADAAAAASTIFFGAFVPAECRTAALYLVCLSNFPFCAITPAGFTVLPPCRSVCENMLAQCTGFFIEYGVQARLPDCDLIDNSTGVPLPAFPPDSSGQCLSASVQTAPPYTEVDCPYPLNFDKHGSPDDFLDICPLPCPLHNFSEGKWWGGYVVVLAFAGMSFTLMVFSVATWLLNPKKRSYPAVLPLWLSVCSLFSAIAVLITVLIGGPFKTVCTWDDPPRSINFDNARDNDGQGVVCVLQACIAVFFSLAGSYWWLALTFNIFEMVVLQIRIEWLKRMYYLYHAAAWGIPLGVVIAGLASEQMEAQQASIVCWMNNQLDWALYYSPLILNQLIGTVLMAVSIAVVVRARFNLKGQSSIKMEQIIRLLSFVVGYWAVFAYLIAFRGYVEETRDPLTDAIQEQIECSALSGGECELTYNLNYGVWFIELVTLGSHGIIVFMCLTFSKDNYRFWMAMIANWRDPWPIITGATSYQNTTTGSRTSNNSRSVQSATKSKDSASKDNLSMSAGTSSNDDL